MQNACAKHAYVAPEFSLPPAINKVACPLRALPFFSTAQTTSQSFAEEERRRERRQRDALKI